MTEQRPEEYEQKLRIHRWTGPLWQEYSVTMHKLSYRVRPFSFAKRQMNAIFVKQLCLFVPTPPEEHFIIFRNPTTELIFLSWLMRSSLVDPDRERGAPVFDPDVTSVMDESRPADGKTQLFQLPVIWHSVRAVLYVGETGSFCRQKRGDTGEKWDMCFLALSTCPSTGCNFPLPLSFLKWSYTRCQGWKGNVWLSWQHISKME